MQGCNDGDEREIGNPNTTRSRPVARFLRGGGHFDVSVDLNTTIIHVV